MIIDTAELRRRYKLRVAGARDKQIYIGPEDVLLFINNACNLTCQYCWFHASGNPNHFDKANFFPWEKFVGVVSDAVDLQVDNINITGSGEPTMHPLFREMMRHLEDKPIDVMLSTNATFPIEYCADVIRGDRVLIDLSAVNRQQYLDLQGKDLFDRVTANIQRLAALRDETKPGFLIEIAYIVNALNVNQKQQMQDLASGLGVNKVYFRKMSVHEYNRDIALPGGPAPDLEGEVKRTPPVCLNGWFNMAVRPDDESTSTCCRIPKMRLGDFDRWSLKQLWFSPQMMNVRLLGKYGQIQKMYKACEACPSYDRNIKRQEALVSLGKNEQAIAQ